MSPASLGTGVPLKGAEFWCTFPRVSKVPFAAPPGTGRAKVSRRTTIEVTGPTGLTWTVRRRLFSVGMLPHSSKAALGSADLFFESGVPPVAGVFLLPFVLPFLPLVLVLRMLRLLPWTIEARTYPWGKKLPPIVHAYEVRGKEEAERAMRDLAAGLASGDGAPDIPGTERVR
jgi:hypothetical protein